MIHFQTLSETSNKTIAECFNAAFSDYSIPLQLEERQLETKLQLEDIDKAISVGAFERERLVGFILHGQRNINGTPVAYNAGTGVRPESRGHGLTRRMYAFIEPRLVEKRFTRVVLEVIATNAPAVRAYQGVGFRQVRKLHCYKADKPLPFIASNITIERSAPLDPSMLKEFCDVVPTWQNSWATIANYGPKADWFLARSEGVLCGFAVCNPGNNRVLQCAVRPDLRRKGIGSALLGLISTHDKHPLSVINIDERAHHILSFLAHHQWQHTLSQFEMEWQLSKD